MRWVYDRRVEGRLVAQLDGGKIAEGRKRLGERALIVKLSCLPHGRIVQEPVHPLRPTETARGLQTSTSIFAPERLPGMSCWGSGRVVQPESY